MEAVLQQRPVVLVAGSGRAADSLVEWLKVTTRGESREKARPAQGPFASRYVPRALLTPCTTPGSVYRRGKST